MTLYKFRYAGAPIDFEMIQIDPKSADSNDLNNAISSVKRNGCAIKGNIETFLDDVSTDDDSDIDEEAAQIMVKKLIDELD